VLPESSTNVMGSQSNDIQHRQLSVGGGVMWATPRQGFAKSKQNTTINW